MKVKIDQEIEINRANAKRLLFIRQNTFYQHYLLTSIQRNMSATQESATQNPTTQESTSDTPVHRLNQSIILSSDDNTQDGTVMTSSDGDTESVESASPRVSVGKGEVNLRAIECTEVTVEEYSEKSYVIHGPATRLWTKELGEMKALFNPRLAKLDHGPGWVIPKTRHDALMAWYEKVKGGELIPDVDEVERYLAEKKASRAGMRNGISGIPTVGGNGSKGRFVMQTVMYKVPALAVGHNLQLTVGTQKADYVVKSVEIFKGRVESAIIHPKGDNSTLSKVVIHQNRWQIWGYDETHKLAIV